MKTRYKGILFKSVLEARTAFVLDKLNIIWEYEPDCFIVEGNSFIPDFKIGKNSYIECKGDLSKEQRDFHSSFAINCNKDILLISFDELFFYNGTEKIIDTDSKLIPANEENSFSLLECSSCALRTFITSLYSFFCRDCGNYEGDHDIKDTFLELKGLKGIYKYLKLEWRKPQNE